MSEVVIYLGPSLPIDIAKTILPDAEYVPPIRIGDLAVANEPFGPPKLIGIIDGELFEEPTASPKEVLQMLDAGVTILGAAGIGALRAVELYPYGMVGIGTIFKWYLNGRLREDDAVAVAYDPDTYKRLSEPLVNIIYALSRAKRDGVIQPHEKSILLRIARSLFFTDRVYERIFAEAAGTIPAERLETLRSYISKNDFDLQKRDAIRLLKAVPKYLSHPPDRSKALQIHGFEERGLESLHCRICPWNCGRTCPCRTRRAQTSSV